MNMLFRYACLGITLIALTYPGAQARQKRSVHHAELGGRPNIIFILTDDQRWDALGYAGNEVIQTPVMDRLAREGTYFSHAMVTTPICSASRASIFTGLHERAHRFAFGGGSIPGEYMEQSYPKLLRDAGYYTGFFGKFGVKYAGTKTLFDEVEDYDRNSKYDDRRGYVYKKLNGKPVHLTRYTGQRALDFIDKAPADKPFCLSLSFSAPHAHDKAKDQYFWQASVDALYQGKTMPGPRLGEDKYFDALPEPVRQGYNRKRWYWRYDTPEKYQHSVKGYYRMIYGVDLEIAKIRARLQERGLDRNTIIIFMGDNGYFLGERQLAGKWLMYDNSVRVPLIVYDPRGPKHQDRSDLALNIDVPATILDLAGVARPRSYHGKSLVPVVTGEKAALDRDVALIEHLWEFTHIPPSEGVRTEQWKYFRYVNNKSEEVLFNLVDDPREIKNLAQDPQHRDTLMALRQQCNRLGRRFLDPTDGVPEGLTVETIRETKGGSVAQPEYGWVIPEKAGKQRACQVLVASSQVKIDQNIGDVWDSGKVSGAQCTDVEHGGGSSVVSVYLLLEGADLGSKQPALGLLDATTF